MPNRHDTLETVQLAVELLRRIPRGRKVTAKELHQQLQDIGLDRDLRTIQRQLQMLSEHFEIECDDRSKPYGYRWLPKARPLAVPNLTAQESLLLRLAEQHLQNLLPSRLMRSMEGFFVQAKRNLGPESNAKLEKQWPRKIRVVETSQPLLPPKISPDVFDVVTEALYTNHWLHLRYKNAAGNHSDIEVMPLGLAQQGPRLYLVCRYKGYDNERSLAVHRITKAKASTFEFSYPKDFDLKQYEKDGRFGFGEGELIRLTFVITEEAGKHLYETPLSRDQQITQQNDHQLKVTATVVDSTMLTWWLRGFGEDVNQIDRQPL